MLGVGFWIRLGGVWFGAWVEGKKLFEREGAQVEAQVKFGFMFVFGCGS
jgi:hypothetical protein